MRIIQDMAKWLWLLALLLVGCSSETINGSLFGNGGVAGAAGGAAGAAGSGVGGVAGADGGSDPDAEDAAEAETDAPCTLVQHFNGYNFFQNCHKVGDYDEELALIACAVYMNVSCEVLTSLNLCGGMNLVGHKSEAWIVWTWTATTGTTRLSWSTPPECPTASDPVWW